MALYSSRYSMLPEYMLEDAYAYEDGLLGAAPAATPIYADAGQQAPQVRAANDYSGLVDQLTNYWKQAGIDPNIRGINRADELAQVLGRQGVTDLSQLSFKSTPYQREAGGGGGGDSDMGATVTSSLVDDTLGQLVYGDKTFGELSNWTGNGTNAFGDPQEYMQRYGDDTYKLLHSAAGKGRVEYMTKVDPATGKVLAIYPQWSSSSDAGDIAKLLAFAAIPFTGGLSAALGGGTLGAIGAGALIGGGVGGLNSVGQGESFGKGFGKGALTGGVMAGVAPFVSDAIGLGAPAGGGSLTAGITPEAVAAFEAGLPGAAGGASALPAAGIGSLTAGMTPEAVAALEAGLPAATDVAATGLLTTPAVVPEAVGSLTAGITPEAVAAAENLLPGAAGAAGIGAPVATAASGLLEPTVQQVVTTGVRNPSLLAPTIGAGAITAAAALTPSTPTAPSPQGSLTENITPKAVEAAEAGLPSNSPLDQLKAWAVANPQLAKMAFTGATSLLSTAGGGGGGGGGGYKDSGYRPTITRGGWQARATPGAPTGLLNNMRPVNLPGQGQANDGLWRYGLLGPGRG